MAIPACIVGTPVDAPQNRSEFVSNPDLAKMLGVTQRTLCRWRKAGIGPSYIRVGPHRLMFRRVDLAAWLDRNSHPDRIAESAAQHPVAANTP